MATTAADVGLRRLDLVEGWQYLPPGTGEVWAVVSRKGGPGKTTVTHALGSGLALRGYKVLTLEVEDNMRLWHLVTGRSQRRGAPPPDDSQTVYGLLRHPERGLGGAAYVIDVYGQFARVPSLSKRFIEQLAIQRGWTRAQPMYFVPGSESLRDVEREFTVLAQQYRPGGAGFNPYGQLARAVEGIRPGFDVVLMDTPPTLNVIQHNAVLAANRVVIVMDFDADSIEDYWRTVLFLEQVYATARALNRRPPEVLGVVYNKYDADFQENDGRLLFAYTNEHVDPETGQREPPLVEHPQLGLLPLDRRPLVAAANARVSVHTSSPTSQLGTRMYDLCARLEEATGMARHNRVRPTVAQVR